MKNKGFGLISKNTSKGEVIDELLSIVDNNSYNFFTQSKPCAVRKINAFDNELLKENINLLSQKSNKEKIQNKFQELDFELKQLDNRIKLAQKEKQYLTIKKLYVERYNILKQMEILGTQPPKQQQNSNTPYWHLIEAIVNLWRKLYLKKLLFERYFQNKIWSRIIKYFFKSKGLKETIDKLNSINKSINNLQTYSVPLYQTNTKILKIAK